MALGGSAWKPYLWAAGRAARSVRASLPLVVALMTIAGMLVPVLAAAPLSLGGATAGAGGGSLGGSAGPHTLATTRTLTITPGSGPVGTNATFQASGFAHHSPFNITWSTSAGILTTVCSKKTDSTGAAKCYYILPPTGAGNYTFTAKDGGGHTAKAVFQVVANLTVTPTSGQVGSIVVVTGFGFAASNGTVNNSTQEVGVSVTWLGQTVCSAATTGTTSLGGFTCGFSLPPSPSGTHVVVATDALGNTSSAPFLVLPRLTVNPSYSPSGPGYGPKGATVSFVGSGFSPTAGATLTWLIGTACATTTSAKGSFYCNYTIPSNVRGGNYTFSATDGAHSASVRFVVTYLVATPGTAPVNSTVAFRGGGYSPNSTITVNWSQGIIHTGTTDASGTLASFPFVVPLLAAGPYPFLAVDGRGRSATVNLTVVPSLATSPQGGPPATSFTLSGEGFAAASGYTIRWAYGPVCNGTTNASGSLRCNYTIPAGTPGGPYVFTAEDDAAHLARTTFTVTFLQVLPPSGAVGSTVALSGGGFSPGASYNITLGSTVVCAGTVTVTGGIGAGCSSYGIPPSAAGPMTFVATDTTGNTASATFTTVPALAVKPSKGAVGTALTFTGTGFGAGVSVSVSWAQGEACASLTDPYGGFACSIALPPASAGPYTFTAVDTDANLAQTTFTVESSLTVVPLAGPVGTPVELNASGFAGLSSISISSPFGIACTGLTDPRGGFACSYTIPVWVRGSLRFTAADASSNTAIVSFSVGSQLSVSPTAGSVGSVLAFSGTGFFPSAGVVLSWSVGTVCSTVTDASGSFGCDYVVPPMPAGAYNFTASDTLGHPLASVAYTVVPRLSANVTTAPVGGPVTFVGSGYTANSSVVVDWDAAPVCLGTVGRLGSFSCPAVVPVATAGPHRVTAVDAMNLSAGTSVVVVPRLTFAPSSGYVGSNLTLLGSGFAAVATVDISWSGGTICSTLSNGSGAFRCYVVMPPATAGPHAFAATDAEANSASANFTVLTSASTGLSLLVSPSGGPPGTATTFQGAGFAGNANVTVAWSKGTACQGLSDANGSFTCTFTIPLSTPGGVYTFSGSDGQGNTASATFVVTFLSAAPSRGPSGTAVTFTAGGFTPNSSFSVKRGGVTSCLGKTDQFGSFTCTFNVTATAPGVYTYIGADGVGVQASTTFVVVPVLSVLPAATGVGSTVNFTGSGFTPSSNYTLAWGGGTVCSGSTNASGGFSCPFVLPATVEGDHTFTASDGGGNNASTELFVQPRLVSAPSSGPVGTNLTLTGSGFRANATVTVNWSGGLACAAVADALGNFSCSMSVPPTVAGPRSFVASQGLPPVAATTFVVLPRLTAAPGSGPIGATLQLNATGFGGGTGIRLSWSGGTACTGTTGPSGSFSCTFAVPAGLAGGNATFTGLDQLGNTASTLVLVIPALFASPDYGVPGTMTTLHGIGYTPNSSVTVTWSGGGIACNATTDSSGTFSCPFTIPLSSPGGPLTFLGTDTAGDRAPATFVVTFLAFLPQSGPVGTSLAITGGGFQPSSPYAVLWAGGSACSGTTSGNGSFSCTYLLPSAPAGTTVFTASDGSGQSATSTFTVVPALSVAPGSGSVGTDLIVNGTGFAASASVTVTWSGGGTVCGPVTTSATGGFSCLFTVPSVPTGVYTFDASDLSSDTASTTFNVVVPEMFAVTFNETGLPNGTSWTVTLNGVATTGSGTTVNFTEPNGAYTYTIASPGFAGMPHAGTVTVASSAVEVPVVFTLYLYAIVFHASGLVGQSWNVTLGSMGTGPQTLSTTGANLTFREPNGSYNFVVGSPAGFSVSSVTGSVAVSGASPAPLDLVFSETTYAVWFNESGLPTGRLWSVQANGATTSSTGPSIELHLANGSYAFAAQADGFNATPSGGSFVVSGAGTALHVTFSKARYTLTFDALGLPAGTAWTLKFNGTSQTVTGASVNLTVPNGTYPWSVSSAQYSASPGAGTVTVAGPPATVSINFTLQLYNVTFTVVGLPSGHYWIVLVSGSDHGSYNTTNTSFTISLPNGSYPVAYTGPLGYTPNPPYQRIHVAGVPLHERVKMLVAQPPPSTAFLGFTGDIAWTLIILLIGGGAGGAAAAGYFYARRQKAKALHDEFL